MFQDDKKKEVLLQTITSYTVLLKTKKKCFGQVFKNKMHVSQLFNAF